VREVVGDGKTVAVSGDARLTGTDIQVPSDVSSAAFFLVAAACLPGSRIEMRGVGLNPARTGIIDVRRRFGAAVETAGEIVSGYFLIKADSYDEAVKIAMTGPHVERDGRIDVREVQAMGEG